MKKLCIFDFDGTLVNTITDVAICFNQALKKFGFKEYPLNDYKDFVGGNLETVVSRLLNKEDRNEENIENVKNAYYEIYNNSDKINTRPYENILELLEKLQENKINIGINTNKKQKLTESLCKKFFPNIEFIKIIGYSEEYPSKPDPSGVLDIINLTKTSKEDTIYIGDGKTDIETAKNARIDVALVTWGQNTEQDLKNEYVKYIVEDTKKLENVIMKG